ncbi:hypothetical protein VPNG_08450 [Cytospora leucostoma]|uniref:Uncharacterized protein n=1 Tax=Cytospora leucostoma TaxID=1230097 RepID=A0A423WRN8_9PEZI|nr:hypothetical protein VPNG_08450 [Cytospora leucostoma]
MARAPRTTRPSDPTDLTGPTAAAELEEVEVAAVAVPLAPELESVPEDPEAVKELVVVAVASAVVLVSSMVADRVVPSEELELEGSMVVVTVPVTEDDVDAADVTTAVDVVVLTAEVLEVEHDWPALMAEQKVSAAGSTCSHPTEDAASKRHDCAHMGIDDMHWDEARPAAAAMVKM